MARSLPRRKGILRYLTLVLSTLGLSTASCDSPSRPPDGQQILDVAATAGTGAPVQIVDVTLREPAPVRVDYWTAGAARIRVGSDAAATTHSIISARLQPGATYRYEVTAEGADPVDGTFTTPGLPASLAALEISTEGVPSHPLTLLEIARNPDGFTGAVIVDAAGRIVWYHELQSIQGATIRDNGNFVFLDVARGVREVTPAGELVVELSQEIAPGRRSHHDVITTPDNTLLVLSHDTREYEGREVTGEAIWEWNPDNGDLERRWSSWDALSPASDWAAASRDSDWLHANAISYGPDGNVLVSLRFTDQVISIAPDFSGIEWRLGGLNADVVVSGEDVFVGQHTASELPAVDGRRRVLLFDNGSIARGYSRAQELELDLASGSATTVWDFRPVPENFSFIVSLARRLPNGNTFVAFGAGPDAASSHGPVEVYEVTAAGETAFRVQVGGEPVGSSFIMYRAWPLSTIAGEEIVVP